MLLPPKKEPRCQRRLVHISILLSPSRSTQGLVGRSWRAKNKAKTAGESGPRAGVVVAFRIGERQEVFYILYPAAQDPSPEAPTHHG